MESNVTVLTKRNVITIRLKMPMVIAFSAQTSIGLSIINVFRLFAANINMLQVMEDAMNAQ